MNRNQTKTFLQRMIKAYPGYKSKIIDKTAFVDRWQFAFERVEFGDMIRAAGIYTMNNRFFPSVDEFKPYVSMIQEQERSSEVSFESSGCIVCPYLEEGQTEPCEHCLFEGKVKTNV